MCDVTTSDINLLTNKIESLDDVSYKESTVTQWSEIAAGIRKIRSLTRHSESKHIPVIYNRYKVLNNCYISECANSDLWEVTHWLETLKLSQISQRLKKKINRRR